MSDAQQHPSGIAADNPIREPEEDLLGRVGVARSFAEQMLRSARAEVRSGAPGSRSIRRSEDAGELLQLAGKYHFPGGGPTGMPEVDVVHATGSRPQRHGDHGRGCLDAWSERIEGWYGDHSVAAYSMVNGSKRV